MARGTQLGTICYFHIFQVRVVDCFFFLRFLQLAQDCLRSHMRSEHVPFPNAHDHQTRDICATFRTSTASFFRARPNKRTNVWAKKLWRLYRHVTLRKEKNWTFLCLNSLFSNFGVLVCCNVVSVPKLCCSFGSPMPSLLFLSWHRYYRNPMQLLCLFLKQDIKSAPIFLFMKGVPEAPQCGFSQRVCQVLQAHGTHVCSAYFPFSYSTGHTIQVVVCRYTTLYMCADGQLRACSLHSVFRQGHCIFE